MSENTPQVGDVAIYTYKENGKTVTGYMMYRMDEDYGSRWFDGNGGYVSGSALSRVQPLPSAVDLHARLQLTDPLAYTPKVGDVATYLTATGSVVTIQYRVGPLHSAKASTTSQIGWFNEFNAPVIEPETDSTFRLLIRDGQPVPEGSN